MCIICLVSNILKLVWAALTILIATFFPNHSELNDFVRKLVNGLSFKHTEG